MVAANDRVTLVGVMRTFGSFSVGREGAAASRVPAVVVVGTGDVLVKEERALAGWWPGAQLVEVTDAGHVDELFRPETVRAIRERIGAGGASAASPLPR